MKSTTNISGTRTGGLLNQGEGTLIVDLVEYWGSKAG